MTLYEIKKAIKTEGFCVVNNIEIVWDEFGTEVSKDGQYEFSCSTWWELEEYLIENGITN